MPILLFMHIFSFQELIQSAIQKAALSAASLISGTMIRGNYGSGKPGDCTRALVIPFTQALFVLGRILPLKILPQGVKPS